MIMSRWLRSLLLGAASFAVLTGCETTTVVTESPIVGESGPMPPPPVLHPPDPAGTAPSGDHEWVPGAWGWDATAGQWEWSNGSWKRRPHEKASWVPGHWAHKNGEAVWVAGYWKIGS